MQKKRKHEKRPKIITNLHIYSIKYSLVFYKPNRPSNSPIRFYHSQPSDLPVSFRTIDPYARPQYQFTPHKPPLKSQRTTLKEPQNNIYRTTLNSHYLICNLNHKFELLPQFPHASPICNFTIQRTHALPYSHTRTSSIH